MTKYTPEYTQKCLVHMVYILRFSTECLFQIINTLYYIVLVFA